MADNFDRCFDLVIRHEGGFVNHPRDPGGATNYGVTQRTYDAWQDRLGAKRRDVALISMAEVRSIYRAQYWNTVEAADLPLGIDYCVFDTAINSGPSRAVKLLQQALGVGADGIIGLQTRRALKAHPNHDALVDAYCDRRLAFLKRLKTWPVFGKGWGRRVEDVRKTAKAWATGRQEPKEGQGFALIGKAYASDLKAPPSPAIGDAATGAGIATASLAQLTEALAPLSHMPTIAAIITALTVAGVVVSLGGIAWRAWASRRGQEAQEIMGAAS